MVINICGCHTKRAAATTWAKYPSLFVYVSLRYMKSNQCIDHNNFDMLRIQIRPVQLEETSGERGKGEVAPEDAPKANLLLGEAKRSSCKMGKQKPQKRQAMSNFAAFEWEATTTLTTTTTTSAARRTRRQAKAEQKKKQKVLTKRGNKK